MTLRYHDGYDYLPNAGMGLLSAAGYYSTAGNGFFGTLTTGRFGFGNAIGFNLNPSVLDFNELVRPIGINATTLFLGVAVNVGSSNQAVQWLTLFDAVTGAPQLSFRFQNFGVISAWRGRAVGGVFLGATNPGSYQNDEWFWLELKGKIDASAGAVQVRVNTVPVLTIPSINTQATAHAYVDAFGFGAQGAGGIGPHSVTFYDDLYVCDDQGAVNNSFLGNVRVKTALTAGAGALTQFSKFGAQPTNWQASSNPNLDDTSYVYTPTTGQKDFYTIQALLGSQAVHGVQVRGAFRQDDATQQIAHNVLRTGGGSPTVVEGVDHFTNQTFTYYSDIWELNPETGVGWTGTEVNALQIGPKNAT